MHLRGPSNMLKMRKPKIVRHYADTSPPGSQAQRASVLAEPMRAIIGRSLHPAAVAGSGVRNHGNAPIQHWHCVRHCVTEGAVCVSDGGCGDPIWGQRTNISASRSCVVYSPGASIAHGKLTLADGGSGQALWRRVGSDAAGHERACQPNSSLARQASLADFPLASDQKLSRCYPPFSFSSHCWYPFHL
ncbi:hypothetical protein BO83DRAFT_444804 [Aspergillus eucalypticola CBS 122712]|uniref:Uncharacterized protein n=1 Tax=Aspergillus eucalypticola (strain CBS 122712 / IBT 29274) TaxID=1448314 RepID=A0A317VIL9_ASPEC|nr:uncharacterized protein BO83DRAFT_444804 [Aspergillus eucalypticola CBS 122712]PWY74216.1 hypothetical protein BO83DRAFT_444804 [Aspergillus eucalypticola CBS 122712]